MAATTLLTPLTSVKAVAAESFVKRSGSQLTLGGKPFRFAGANIYWLGLDENVGGVDYPTHGRIDSALTDARSMNATAIRAHTLGISVGCAKCIEPELGRFNESAFDSIDYAVKSARDHNLRLVVPLVDQWNYYHGGKSTFLAWRGLANRDDDRNAKSNVFHTDPTVRRDFKAYIAHVLNHKNQYTGIALKDDPTIMMWQTGNELFTWNGGWNQEWTHDIAGYIKGLAPNQLIGDGRIASEEHPFTEAQYLDQLAEPLTDVMDMHHYPKRTQMMGDSVAATTRAGKAVMVGEYDWTTTGDGLANYLAAVEGSGAAGDLYWSLFPNGVTHNDSYTLHYPGDTPAMKSAVQTLASHAARMAGTAAATPSVTPEPSVPVTSVTGNLLKNASFEVDATKNGNPRTTFDPWWLELKPGATADLSRDTATHVDGASSARLDLAATNAPYKQQLYQHVALEAGRTYRLSFYAKADAARPASLVLQRGTGDYAVLSETMVSLTTGWQRYTATYQAKTAEVDALFAINVGGSAATVWIDAASLAPTSGSKADLDGDDKVGIVDLSLLLSAWGKTTAGDLNGDGKTDIIDLSMMLTAWTA